MHDMVVLSVSKQMESSNRIESLGLKIVGRFGLLSKSTKPGYKVFTERRRYIGLPALRKREPRC